MANRPSKIDKLPPEIRDLIGDLRERGYTLDEIMDHLHRLDGVEPGDLPSRSGLGRHIQGLDQLSERLHRSRTVAEALVRKLGDAPEARQTRLNIELMHSVITELFMAEADDEGKVVMDAGAIANLSKALDHLTRAAERDADATIKLRKEFAAEAAKKVDAVVKEAAKAGERGLTAERVNQLRRELAGMAT